MISELGEMLKQNKNIEFRYLLIWYKFYHNLPDEAVMEVFIIVIPVLIFQKPAFHTTSLAFWTAQTAETRKSLTTETKLV